MHEVQKKLENAAALQDKHLVDLVIDTWLVVVEENDSQRALVTEGQFKSWTDMKEVTNEKLRKAIKTYTGLGLSTASREVFESIAASIRGASHKTAVELGGESPQPQGNLSLAPEHVDIYEEQRNKWTGALAI